MKELLLKYIDGDCTDQEKLLITNWLDSDPENMKEYLTLRRLNDISIWQTNSSTQLQKKISKKGSNPKWNTIYSEILKIAAVFVIAFFAFHYFLSGPVPQPHEITMQAIHVPAGQRAEITLGDGTKVWLNAKTTLTFPSQFTDQNRIVKLDGEGFFDVTHDKTKPFIVQTEKYNVKVLGTKFNLMAYSEIGNFETSLLEGSVEVLGKGSTNGTIIKPNERIFLKDNQMVIAPIVQMNHFLWKDGIISFDDETFPEIVDKLELYFDTKILLRQNNPLNFRCTGKFRTKDGVEHILKVLQLGNKFDYAIDYKQNVITIR